jgi:hypothetical protein
MTKKVILLVLRRKEAFCLIRQWNIGTLPELQLEQDQLALVVFGAILPFSPAFHRIVGIIDSIFSNYEF